MTYTVPTTEPTEVTAGSTWRWNRSLPDYPNAAHSLAYAVKGDTAIAIAVVASTDDPNGYEMTAAATATAALVAGTYEWISRVTVTATGQVIDLDRGVINVRENLATATPAATHNRAMLTAIRALLRGRAVADVESYSINGRALNRIPFADLRKYERSYAFAAWAEAHPGQAMPSQNVVFNSPNVGAFPFGVVPGTLA